MTKFEWLSIGLSAVAMLLIPALVILIRGAIKWTHAEDKLGQLVEDVRKLVEDKEKAHSELAMSMNKVHAELLEQMREDRRATDARLRFIEEAWMRNGNSYPAA